MIYDDIEFNTKSELRKYLKLMRSSIDFDDRFYYSRCIANNLFDLEEYKNADIILSYVNYNSEVMTDYIINHALEAGKLVAVPKVIDKETMKFYYIKSLEDLSEGAFGIKEPKTGDIFKDDATKKVLMLMPGLAFDDLKYRLGYGGGYYDRYLSMHQINNKIMLAFEMQHIKDKLLIDKFDLPADKIITELKIYE